MVLRHFGHSDLRPQRSFEGLESSSSILLLGFVHTGSSALTPPAIGITMASLGGSVPMFRSLAPRFSKDFFTCRQCLGRTQTYATKSLFRKQFAGLSFGQKSSNATPKAFSVTATKFFSPILRRSVAGSAVAGALEDGASQAKSSFPKVSDKIVAYWLLGSAASVFGIVVFGGLTRLTESGYVLPYASQFERHLLTLSE